MIQSDRRATFAEAFPGNVTVYLLTHNGDKRNILNIEII